jgi:integrase/recombinase XerD
MKNYYDYEMPDILKDYLNYLFTIKGKSKNTILVYFYDLRIFFKFIKKHYKLINDNVEFDDIDILDIDVEIIKRITLSDLYSYISYVSTKRDNMPQARARKVASLKSFFKYLVNKSKILEENPARDLESPKIAKLLPKYLNVDESIKLLSSVNGEHYERNFAIVTLFLNCGMRLSELVNMSIPNIKDDFLTIIGKGQKERSIPLNKACTDAIKNYLVVRPNPKLIKDKDALFLSERRLRISKNTVQYIIKKFIRESGLDSKKYSTHKLRHTAATLMYKHGKVDIRTLQELLGHESISTTEIYTHLDKEELKKAVDLNPLANFTQKK